MSIPILSEIRNQLNQLGYIDDLIKDDYAFDDATSPLKKDLHIPLAAFAQNPPSYRSACIGVLNSNGNSGEKFVSEYRTLGAPLFFETFADHIRQYKVNAKKAEFIESIQANEIQNAFEHNKDRWSPEIIFRAKLINQHKPPYQLDFVDIGLMPALRGMIGKKIDRLLDSIITEAIRIFKLQINEEPNNEFLFRLVFRFLAAKIFRDRQHRGNWGDNDARNIINEINNFYNFSDIEKHNIIDDPGIQQVIWNNFIDSFNFQNLSVDDLAFIYENTFIQKDSRKRLGIHSTPPEIADLIVNRLPIELLEQNDRFVLEPFAGHGIFLISSLRKLRDLLPSSWTAQQRHEYLKERLTAIEIEVFSAEVCRLCLMLADYPNPNGWNVIPGDIFDDGLLEEQLIKSKIVLCNPPFEDFKEPEKLHYGDKIKNYHKPFEILRRILTNPPAMLGYVMPKSALMGENYRELQKRIALNYRNVEIIMMPDRIFRFSDQETALLIAFDRNDGSDAIITTNTFWISDKNKPHLFETGQLPVPVTKTISRLNYKGFSPLWAPLLGEVWDYVKDYPRLHEVSEFHRGIEWNISLKHKHNRNLLISEHQQPGFTRGLDTSKDKIEAYYAHNFVYLNMEDQFKRTDNHYLPWTSPKVVLNKARLSRSPWRVAGYPDHDGLVLTQYFTGLWPRDDINIEVLSAIVNSPIANAMVYLNGFGRDNPIKLLEDVPIPPAKTIDIQEITRKVKYYIELRSSLGLLQNNKVIDKMTATLLEIDGLLLKSYDFPPRLERKLLDFFRGFQRPVPFDFYEYFPDGFAPCIPLHMYLKMDLKKLSAKELFKRIKPIDSTEANKFAKNLKRWFS